MRRNIMLNENLTSIEEKNIKSKGDRTLFRNIKIIKSPIGSERVDFIGCTGILVELWKEDEQANIAFIDPVSKILIERVFNTDSFVYL